MNPSGISTEPHPAAQAMLHSKGKASQWPAFTPVPLSQLGLIRHHNAQQAQRSILYLWQGGIGSGVFDCNVLSATSLGA